MILLYIGSGVHRKSTIRHLKLPFLPFRNAYLLQERQMNEILGVYATLKVNWDDVRELEEKLEEKVHSGTKLNLCYLTHSLLVRSKVKRRSYRSAKNGTRKNTSGIQQVHPT